LTSPALAGSIFFFAEPDAGQIGYPAAGKERENGETEGLVGIV
jgi:hypothetical protein